MLRAGQKAIVAERPADAFGGAQARRRIRLGRVKPRCKIAPTETVDVSVPGKASLDLARMRRGLIPW